MRIVVLVKEVPDTYGERALNLETALADRAATDAVLDEIGERALEVALSYADADAHADAEVVVVTMGPESAVTTVRKALAMGAGSAVHVVGDALVGADMGLTAEVLAAALRRIGFDLVIAGNVSTDGSGGMLPAMLAELLDVPQLTALSAVEISPESVSGTRASDAGVMTVSAPLPAIVSVTEALPDARFPNFKGIMAAKKKPYETIPVAELGIDPDTEVEGRSIVIQVAQKPPRRAGVTIVDDGDAGERLAEFLVSNRLV